MSPRLFASDLDGTLLGGDSELSPTTVDTLRRVRDLGGRVIAVTGRSPSTALPRLQPHGVIDAALCNNGAVEVDVVKGEILTAAHLSAESLADLFEQLEKVLPGSALAWETETGFAENRSFTDLGIWLETSNHEVVDGYPDPLSMRTTKIAVAHRDHSPFELAELVANTIECDLEFATSGAPFLEATAAGVNKGAALARYCEINSIERTSVVAYGDNHNDVSMLAWAGTGVAVGNAHESAVAAADEQIGHHRDHAVALDMLSRLRAGSD